MSLKEDFFPIYEYLVKRRRLRKRASTKIQESSHALSVSLFVHSFFKRRWHTQLEFSKHMFIELSCYCTLQELASSSYLPVYVIFSSIRNIYLSKQAHSTTAASTTERKRKNKKESLNSHMHRSLPKSKGKYFFWNTTDELLLSLDNVKWKK